MRVKVPGLIARRLAASRKEATGGIIQNAKIVPMAGQEEAGRWGRQNDVGSSRGRELTVWVVDRELVKSRDRRRAGCCDKAQK